MIENQIQKNFQKQILKKLNEREAKERFLSFVPGRISDFSEFSAIEDGDQIQIQLKTTRLAIDLSSGLAQSKAKENVKLNEIVSWATSKGIRMKAIPIFLKIKFGRIRSKKHLNWISDFSKDLKKFLGEKNV